MIIACFTLNDDRHLWVGKANIVGDLQLVILACTLMICWLGWKIKPQPNELKTDVATVSTALDKAEVAGAERRESGNVSSLVKPLRWPRM
jgi:hypothetical protein